MRATGSAAAGDLQLTFNAWGGSGRGKFSPLVPNRSRRAPISAPSEAEPTPVLDAVNRKPAVKVGFVPPTKVGLPAIELADPP